MIMFGQIDFFGTLLLIVDSAPWKSTTMGITKYLQSMRLCWGSAEADLITSLIKSSDDINGIFWHQGLRILLLNYTYILSGYQKLGYCPMHQLTRVGFNTNNSTSIGHKPLHWSLNHYSWFGPDLSLYCQNTNF